MIPMISVMKLLFPLLVVSCCTLTAACGGKSVSHVEIVSSEQSHRDSLLLLHVKEIKQNGFEYDYFHYLDTVNLRYSIVRKSRMEIISYQYCTLGSEGVAECHRPVYEDYVNAADGIAPKEYFIDYDYIIEEGKISESKLHNAKESFFWEYDSLSNLCAITNEEQQCLLTWEGSSLKQVVEIPLWAEGRVYRTDIMYREKSLSTYFSPILLCTVIGTYPDGILFASLGLYGQIPIGGCYHLTKKVDAYNEEIIEKSEKFIEKYSENGLLTECIKSCGDHNGEKLLLTWQAENIAYFDRLLKRRPVGQGSLLRNDGTHRGLTPCEH